MYQITLILTDENISGVKKVLEKHKAEIVGADELRKIKLAYPIRKFEYGFLGSIKFKIEPQSIGGLFFDLKLTGNIIRYMVNQVGEKEPEVREKSKIAEPALVGRKEILKEELKRQAEPILTNEEIEKKIEEILQ